MLRQRRWLALLIGVVIGLLVGLFFLSPTAAAVAGTSRWVASGGLGKWLVANKDPIEVASPLISSLGVLFAGAGVLVAGMNFRLAATTAYWNSARDCLWHFNKDWVELYQSRQNADAFLDGLPKPLDASKITAANGDLDLVLNFFDNMAFMGNRRHINNELAWQNYYEEAKNLWQRARPYAEWTRATDKDGTLWIDLERWLPALEAIDNEKRRLHPAPELKKPEAAAPAPPPPAAAPQIGAPAPPPPADGESNPPAGQ